MGGLQDTSARIQYEYFLRAVLMWSHTDPADGRESLCIGHGALIQSGSLWQKSVTGAEYCRESMNSSRATSLNALRDSGMQGWLSLDEKPSWPNLLAWQWKKHAVVYRAHNIQGYFDKDNDSFLKF